MTIEQAKAIPGYQRYRLRKKGIDVPFIPHKKGYTQTPEHVENRKRSGKENHGWLGDRVSEKGGRTRALRLFPKVGPCVLCGAKKSERHHIDGNTANNVPENILILCRRCHMKNDGRLEQFRELAFKVQPMGVKARWDNHKKS